MKRSLAVVFVAALTLPACATVPGFVGGPTFPLDRGLASHARIGSISVEATPDVIERFAQSQGDYQPVDRTEPRWQVDTLDEMEFANAISEGVEARTADCATGSRPLTARILIDDIRYDERLSSLIDAKGRDEISGIVELVDASTTPETVVGRHALTASVNSGGFLTRILTDRIDAMAEGFGQALCDDAFG